MTYVKGGYHPWNKGRKLGTTEPMSFDIPKGYKSPFSDLAVGLNTLWMGKKNKKFLRQFHKVSKKGTFTEALADNLTGYSFSPDNVKETPTE